MNARGNNASGEEKAVYEAPRLERLGAFHVGSGNGCFWGHDLNQIDARLQKIVRDVFGDDSLVLTDSTKPVEVSGWDSFGHVNFMLSVEDEFGVEFSEDEFVGFEDVGRLKRMLAEKLVNP